MTSPSPPPLSEREGASTIYYGKTFRNYGPDWVKNGLQDFVPFDIIAKVIIRNIPGTELPAHYPNVPKEKLVDILMSIYNKSTPTSKMRIEKWVFAHRFRRKVQTDYPFLKQLETFYMYLRTNPIYKINVPPDAATKVASHLTLTGIDSLPEVKSVLKSILCKKRSDWEAFDSLFNKWFTSSVEAYSSTHITPSSSSLLHYEEDPSISLKEALSKIHSIIDKPQITILFDPSTKHLGGPQTKESKGDSGRSESPESEPKPELEEEIYTEPNDIEFKEKPKSDQEPPEEDSDSDEEESQEGDKEKEESGSDSQEEESESKSEEESNQKSSEEESESEQEHSEEEPDQEPETSDQDSESPESEQESTEESESEQEFEDKDKEDKKSKKEKETEEEREDKKEKKKKQPSESDMKDAIHRLLEYGPLTKSELIAKLKSFTGWEGD